MRCRAAEDSPFDGAFDLYKLDGTNGFVINGIDPDDSPGISVSGVGDVNGDGIGDLIIGAYGAAPGGNDDAGESYVVFGVSGYTWVPPGGGDFEGYINWAGRRVPGTAGGVVILRPDFGGTINGPAASLPKIPRPPWPT